MRVVTGWGASGEKIIYRQAYSICQTLFVSHVRSVTGCDVRSKGMMTDELGH